ncbi:MAG TPA: GDP-mannose 4,6-dehydratase [Candidatus Hydrogenedens sp.]|nr:GDP-mannose 4,6-dehydratase [Candidatus Hydrogenedens sp.]
MKKRALVTGAGGFVGQHLLKHLQNCGWEVFGCDVVRREGLFYCDLQNKEQIETLLNQIGSISTVFHLSAISFVPQSMQDPLTCFKINTDSVIMFTELLHKYYGKNLKFVFVSSSEVYGLPCYLPINEKHPLNPQNPYAISKLTSDLYCQYLNRNNLLLTIIIRPFNHSGAGQSERFVLSSFAKQFVEIEKGIKEPNIQVGNIEVERDFLHVSDVVQAYEILAQHGKSGEVYNLCSGKHYSIRKIIETLQKETGIKVKITVDSERMRTYDISKIYGSYEKLKADTSWEPKLNINDILTDLLDYWRSKLNSTN